VFLNNIVWEEMYLSKREKKSSISLNTMNTYNSKQASYDRTNKQTQFQAHYWTHNVMCSGPLVKFNSVDI
jgi:hypothetical protein